MGLYKLQESTICQLSSSQVITSVASVVKELVENALDAGATTVDVKLENYGLDKIVVRDNGTGLQPSEVACVAKKHYTSKLTCFDDLNRLMTYGFRGEALASLCNVADVSITTRTAESEVASTYEFDCSGNILSSVPSHLPQGTTVAVTNLFKKYPVRRNYYSTGRRCQAELQRVDDCLVAFAVVRCALRITFRHNGTVVWTKAATSDVQHSLAAVIGSKAVAAMKHIERNSLQPSLQVEAMLPLAGVAGLPAVRSTKDRMFVFVNKRPVTFVDITKLLRDYFNQAVPSADVVRYPVAFLHLTVPPAEVDVNQEPNKSQVMLHNKEDVLKLLGSIFEEVYGPLSSSDTINGVVHPTCSISEPASIDAGNGTKQVTCSSQLCELTTLSSTDTLPPAAEVNVSSVHLSSVGDADTRPAVGNLSVPTKQAQLMSDDSHQPSDIARDWSAGTLVTAGSGKSVEPVKLLTGCSVVNRGTLQTSSCNQPCGSNSSASVKPSTSLSNDSQVSDVDHQFAAYGGQNRTGNNDASSVNGANSETESSKTRLKRKATNAIKLASKKSKSDLEKGLQTICLEKLFSSPRFQSRTVSRESRSISLNFSLSLLKKRLQAMNESSTPRACTDCRLKLIGRLKSHGVWVCVTGDEHLVLFHLVRAQEQMLFARMMAGHVLPVENFQQPLKLDVRSLGSVDRWNVLLSLAKSKPVPTHPYCYFTDQRIVANGFAVREFRGDNAEDHVIEMTGATKCVSYYGIADLNEILSAIQLNNTCDLTTSRSVKVRHYFQSEAVRLARQLSADVTASEVKDILTEMTNIVPQSVTNCFHNRPFIIPLVNLEDCRLDRDHNSAASQ